jgi:hypothetical protein
MPDYRWQLCYFAFTRRNSTRSLLAALFPVEAKAPPGFGKEQPSDSHNVPAEDKIPEGAQFINPLIPADMVPTRMKARI